MIAALALQLVAAAATESLMARGVSLELARHRAAQISNVRYELNLDVTRLDTATGVVQIRFVRRGGGDVILDFRGQNLTFDSIAGVVWNGSHARIHAAALRDRENSVTARFKTPIAPS